MTQNRWGLILAAAAVMLLGTCPALAQEVDLSGQVRPRWESRDAIDLDRDFAVVRFELARLVAERGQAKEAEEHLLAALLVDDVAPAELDPGLHLVALGEKLARVLRLEVEVVVFDPRPHLHFLELHLVLLLPSLACLPLLLVAELPVVHDPAHRRVRHGRDLDEVELEATGHPQRLGNGFDPELVAVGTDQADLTGPDAVVDTVLVALRRCYDCSLLCNGLPSHVRLLGLLDATSMRSGPPANPLSRWPVGRDLH